MNNYSLSFPPPTLLPPIMQNAIEEANTNIKAPYDLVFASLMSAISLACQGLIDVSRPTGQIGPVALNLLTIAESGERKTATDNIFLEPIRAFDSNRLQQEQIAKVNFETDLEVWQCEFRAIRKQLTKEKDPESKFVLQESLRAHIQAKPQKPKRARLLLQDSTIQAAMWAMQGQNASVGLITSEGGTALSGPMLASTSILNEIWDGAGITVDRRSSESFVIRNPRLTISLMVQPKTFESYLKKKGLLARDNGFLARCLTVWPISTQGFRPIQSIQPAQWPQVTKFRHRLTQILLDWQRKESDPDFQREVLEFSPDAKVAWTEYFNFVEVNLQYGGSYSQIRDAASKSPEQVARMAALFHYFESRKGPIQPDTLAQAIHFCRHFLQEYLRLYCPPPPIPQNMQDSMVLDAWLRMQCSTHGVNLIKKNILRQFGPNQLREKGRLDAAISTLMWAGRIFVGLLPDGRTHFVELNMHSAPYSTLPSPR